MTNDRQSLQAYAREMKMMQMKDRRFALAVIFSAAFLTLTGCRVDTHKEGNDDNVKIATPFGGLSVKTNGAVVQQGVGLSVYPGAQAITDAKKQSDDKDHVQGAADINLSFGAFHLGVKALSYRTPDDPEKVLAFYRKDMARYGQVIFCKRNQAVGTPTRTQDGLTCDKDGRGNIHVNNDYDSEGGELKAGSKQHQHIVALDKEGSGTKIGLVALDLPGHLSVDDDEDERGSKQ